MKKFRAPFFMPYLCIVIQSQIVLTRVEVRRMFSSKWPKNPTFFSQNSTKMKRIQSDKRMVTLDGMMTVGQLENGMHFADFECCEDVQTTTIARSPGEETASSTSSSRCPCSWWTNSRSSLCVRQAQLHRK